MAIDSIYYALVYTIYDVADVKGGRGKEKDCLRIHSVQSLAKIFPKKKKLKSLLHHVEASYICDVFASTKLAGCISDVSQMGMAE